MSKADAHAPLHVVIVGAGFAGLNAARKLVDAPGVRVTLIDRRNHHLFQPLLYQVASSTLSAPDISRSIRGLFERADNVEIVYEDVSGVDFETRTLTCRSGREFSYDKLLLSPGARTSYFGNDQWAEHCHELKTLDDATSIRRSVLRRLELAENCPDEEERQRMTTIAIVGGGPTGVELAGSFSELIRRSMRRSFRNFDTSKQRVVLIEAMDRLLLPYTEEQSAYTADRLRELGVEVSLNDMVTDVQEGRVELKSGKVIEAGTIIWAAGVRSASLMTQLGIETDRAGRVAVKPDLSVPGHPDVYLAGDVVSLIDEKTGKPIPGIATAAIQQGKHVAKLISRLACDRNDPKSCEPFDYFDKGSMAIIGRNHAVASSKGIHMTGFTAWFAWLFIHLIYLVGFRNQVSVVINWMSNYLRDRPGTRVFAQAAGEDASPGQDKA